MKKKYVVWNMFASLGSQVVSIVISLVLPKLLIETYGSAVNGLVSTTARIAGYFALIQGGVVAATGVYLYRALAKGDYVQVNGVFAAAHVFFVKTGLIAFVGAAVFSILFPWEFRGSGTYWLAVAVCFVSFFIVIFGYIFFFKYNMIVDADQKSYLIVNSLIVCYVISAGIQIVLILHHASILLVVLVPVLVGVVRLFVTRIWVRAHYHYLSLKVMPAHYALQDRWESLAISVSRVLKFVVPAIYVVLFFGFEYSSVFVIYAIIFNVGSSIVEMGVHNLAGTMGRIAATSDLRKLRSVYEAVSSGSIYAAAALSVCFIVLFHSFIEIYLGQTPDVSYWFPILMGCFVLNEFVNNIRFAPNLLVRASGHIRQTSKSAVVEVLAALVLTPIGVFAFGFQGILIGCIVSSFYRTVFVEWYCRRKILGMGMRAFVVRLSALGVQSGVLAAILLLLVERAESLWQWLTDAMWITGVSSVFAILLCSFVDRSSLKLLFRFFAGRPGHV